MAGQLSPDGNYYWDGTRWANALSPDGAWRWDGGAWQAVPQSSATAGVARPVIAVIALAVIAVLIITGFGLWAGARLIAGAGQNLQSSLAPDCAQNGIAGEPVGQGDMVCGARVRSSVVAADCTSGTPLPSFLVAEHIAPAASDWSPADVGMDAGGCELVAQHHEITAIDSTEELTPDVTLIADFATVDFVGSVGLRLGCTSTGCLDIGLFPDGTFELDEGTRDDQWKELNSGSLALAPLHRYGDNRLILRFADGVATAYLNGHEVTRSTPDLTQMSGYIGFYADNEDPSGSEHVQLRRLYVFDS